MPVRSVAVMLVASLAAMACTGGTAPTTSTVEPAREPPSGGTDSPGMARDNPNATPDNPGTTRDDPGAGESNPPTGSGSGGCLPCDETVTCSSGGNGGNGASATTSFTLTMQNGVCLAEGVGNNATQGTVTVDCDGTVVGPMGEMATFAQESDGTAQLCAPVSPGTSICLMCTTTPNGTGGGVKQAEGSGSGSGS